jgi:bifunctional enzyme CysN/CysC
MLISAVAHAVADPSSDAEASPQDHAGTLRVLTCGSVDDGKSTLIGRLLHDTRFLREDEVAALTRDSRRWGTTESEPDLALLVDGLDAEREQGITIDVAYRFFSTPRRAFVLVDTPGHEQYTRNMATGASNADVAVLLVDARKGQQDRPRRVRRHGVRGDRRSVPRYCRTTRLLVGHRDPDLGAVWRQCRDAERAHALV